MLETARSFIRLLAVPLQVTSIHIDRHKVVTASDRYGEAPVRVWCADTGDCLAELGSCLTPGPLGTGAEGSSAGEIHETSRRLASSLDLDGARLGAAGEAADAAGMQLEEAEETPTAAQPTRRQYHRCWEGVTALACRGAVLVTGQQEGTVCERDWSRGAAPDLVASDGTSDRALAGKFWQYHDHA
jgi:hypothetical protein